MKMRFMSFHVNGCAPGLRFDREAKATQRWQKIKNKNVICFLNHCNFSGKKGNFIKTYFSFTAQKKLAN